MGRIEERGGRVKGAWKKMGKQLMVFDEHNTLVFPLPKPEQIRSFYHNKYPIWTQSVPPRLKTSDSSSTRNPCWQPLIKLNFGLQFCYDSYSRMEFLYGFLTNSYLPCLMEMLRLAKSRSGFRKKCYRE